MKKALFLLVILMFSCNNETMLVANKVVEIDSKEKELEVYNFEGLEKQLRTTTNTVYVVNFWATWCAPCVKELPYLEKLNKNYSNQNVEVILVSLDFPNAYETTLKPFIKEKKLQSKVVTLNDTDSNTWIPKVSKDWSGAIPAILIFNKDKRRFYEQSFTYTELENEIKQFIK